MGRSDEGSDTEMRSVDRCGCWSATPYIMKIGDL